MADDVEKEPGIRELKARLSDYVGRATFGKEVVFIKKNNRRVAALVPAEWAEQMLADRAKDES